MTMQAIKGGVQIALGSTHDFNRPTQAVTASSVRELIGHFETRQDVKDGRSQFEFRLTERDGQAFLQLKERNWASRFKEKFNIGSQERAEQRLQAMQAINVRFGLGINTLNAATTASRTEAQNFFNTNATAMAKAYDANRKGELKLSADELKRTPEKMRADLTTLHQSASADGMAPRVRSDLDTLFDKKVWDSLNRTGVSIDAQGALRLGGPGPGTDEAKVKNLETIVGFFEKASGLSRQDPGFAPMMGHVLRSDHFLLGAQAGRDINAASTAKFGLNANEFQTQARNAISFANNGFHIKQEVEKTVVLGEFNFDQNANALRSFQAISREQSFDLKLADLTSGQFDIARDVRNLIGQDKVS
jgi:hypothetical protein